MDLKVVKFSLTLRSNWQANVVRKRGAGLKKTLWTINIFDFTAGTNQLQKDVQKISLGHQTSHIFEMLRFSRRTFLHSKVGY